MSTEAHSRWPEAHGTRSALGSLGEVLVRGTQRPLKTKWVTLFVKGNISILFQKSLVPVTQVHLRTQAYHPLSGWPSELLPSSASPRFRLYQMTEATNMWSCKSNTQFIFKSVPRGETRNCIEVVRVPLVVTKRISVLCLPLISLPFTVKAEGEELLRQSSLKPTSHKAQFEFDFEPAEFIRIHRSIELAVATKE